MKKKFAIILAMALSATCLFSACGNQASGPASDASAPGDTGSSTAGGEAVWPSTGTVEIYVPFAAGGNSDLCARIFAEAFAKETGSNFVVVNQTEGNGAVCYNNIANAPADGSILGWVTPSWFTSYFAGTHDLNPVEKFSTMAVTTALTAQYLIVPNDSPFDTVQDLVDYCAANPNSLIFGMQLGSASHYYAENCKQNLGITWNYVETGSGDTARITAIMGNIIEATTVNGAQALQYVEAGEVKALCSLTTAGGTVPDALKGIPSLEDCGYDNITVDNVNFLYGPVMDDALCEAINQTFTKIFNDTDVQQQLLDLNQEQELCEDYAQATEMVNSLYDSYRSVAESLGVLAPGM
ncbi:hypothetical protein I4100191B2_23930 [Clostridiales bacterium]